MHPPRALLVLPAIALTACHAYTPAPVDLAAHAANFATRLPDPAAWRDDVSLATPFALSDGLSRSEGRLVAMLFHPDCRLARGRAGVAQVGREYAGSMPDPELSTDVARILETVPHQWIVDTALGFTLPLNGRLGLEQQLASAHVDEALQLAWRTQHDVAQALDVAWVHWSVAGERVTLLRLLGDRLDELRGVATRLQEAGQMTLPAARVFALEHVSRQAELARAEAAATLAELELKRALGLHPEATLQLVPSMSVPLDVADAADRRARLFVSPELASLHAAHHVAERRLELEVQKQWPDFVLRTGWQEEDAEPRAALGLSIPLPLFTGNDPAIARAAAERAVTAEALRCGYERLVQQLAIAEARRAAADRQRQFVVEQLVPLADQQLVDATRLGELGELDALLILDAVVRAHGARADALTATEDAALATVAINTLFAAEAAANPSEVVDR